MNASTEPEARNQGCGWMILIFCAVACGWFGWVEVSKAPLGDWTKVLAIPAFFCILLTFIGGFAGRIITVPFLGVLGLPGFVGLICWCWTRDEMTSAIVVDVLLLGVAGFALFNRLKVRPSIKPSTAEIEASPGLNLRQDKVDQ